MKRWLIGIVIFLLAGAVVSVAVACGCAVLVRTTEQATIGFDSRGTRLSWQVRRSAGFGHDQAAYTALYALSNSQLAGVMQVRTGLPEAPYWIDWQNPDQWLGHQTVLYIGAGWPWRCLAARSHEFDVRWHFPINVPLTRRQVNRIGVMRFDPYWREALVLRDQEVGGPFTARVIPLDPVWHTFILNSMFYAVVLWLLSCGPYAARRFVRMKRGQCVKCGYPLGESDVCTECGRAMPVRARATT